MRYIERVAPLGSVGAARWGYFYKVVKLLDNQSKTKNQHYVPRMYMKRFGYGTEDNPRISVLFTDTGKVLNNQNPDNFASNHLFYDVPKDLIEDALKNDFIAFPELKENENLKDEQFIEHALSREEGAFRQMLDVIKDNPQEIYNDKTRAVFICFVHELAYRTKGFRDMMDKINNQTEEVLRQMCDNIGLSEEEKEQTIKANCISGKRQQIESIVSVAPILKTMNMLEKNYNWYIAYNDTDLDLVISDDPVKSIRMGLNDVCIPMTKQLAVVLRVKGQNAPLFSKDIPNENAINMTLQSVVAYNLLQIGMSQRYVFGSQKAIQNMKSFNGLDSVNKILLKLTGND